MKRTLTIVLLFLLVSSALLHADGSFQLKSLDVAEGRAVPLKHHLNGFGCNGNNLSPALNWSGAPNGTKSYVITLYDPDASSGSGWWHWSVYNIPANVKALPANAGSGKGLPKEAVQGLTDFGSHGFAGPCPPPGEVHRYEFRVHALSVEKLELPENATPAMVGFMSRANALGVAKLTAIVTR